MIIQCVNCRKKFNVNSELIPLHGRTIQCGLCNHIWFFKKTTENQSLQKKEDNIEFKKEDNEFDFGKIQKKTKITKKNTGLEIVKYKSNRKSNFTFSKFLSYLLVLIISFIALIIVIDTFKNPLFTIFPNLENLLFSLFETLKDVKLFIKDLF